MIQEQITLGAQKATHRIWVISDLQQNNPDEAEACLSLALRDMESLQDTLTDIWYLGDATEGRDLEKLKRMTEIQIRLLRDFGVPVNFVLGNHDLDACDLKHENDPPFLPMFDAITSIPEWRTLETCEDFYFVKVYGDTLVVFLSDHLARDHSWRVCHHRLHGPHPQRYPHNREAYLALREKMKAWPGPILLASHYAFAGGVRGPGIGGLLNQLLPLPDNVKLILHGHAHTGDWRYGRERTFQRVSWVNWQSIPQVNVSSLERQRSGQTRSALLDFYPDGTSGVFLRDHERHTWSESFFLSQSHGKI